MMMHAMLLQYGSFLSIMKREATAIPARIKQDNVLGTGMSGSVQLVASPTAQREGEGILSEAREVNRGTRMHWRPL